MIRLCECMSVIVVLESCHVSVFCTVHVFVFVLEGASSCGVIRIRLVLQILGCIHWDCHKGTSFDTTSQFVCHKSHGHVAYRIQWDGNNSSNRVWFWWRGLNLVRDPIIYLSWSNNEFPFAGHGGLFGRNVNNDESDQIKCESSSS